ncbi:alpha/beta hydrolase [Aestuariivirga litoralis]|uniref:Alpha/beta hydrolase n=1 Tax=Aestuariivirga litoralis TaxID=2650924 RepID=A0A2W2ASP7_9HYPH|nr:alpha/beta fold hydrolase [Aestuariivirga litoralis]PZF76672.1 alpha/beta hydrolase [Aestuariivirga litoralis]
MQGLTFKTLGGEGPDLVLIHGFGSDRLSWAGTSPALMEVARVHSLDLPGHGDSLAADAGDGSAAALAGAVTAALDAQGMGPVHLLGHSLGGSIAMLMALGQPERVRSLTLLAPAGLGHAIDHDFLARFPDLATKEEAEALLQKLVSKPLLINRFTIARVLEQLSRTGAREALRAIAKGVEAHEEQLGEAARLIAATGLPRLVIFGGADAINPPSPAALAAFGGQQLVIPEAGHLPHVEAARQVNAAITAFITRVGG